MAAVVFAKFVDGVVPTGYLWRPLLVCAGLAVVLGGLSLLTGKWAIPLSAAVPLLLAAPGAQTVLLVSIGALVGLVARMIGRPLDAKRVIPVVAAVFWLAGIVQAVPLMSFSFGTPAHAGSESDGPPVYLILLDGYSRADVLNDLNIDIRPFIQEMEDRGFDHYPRAKSLHYHTHWTLTAMLAGHISDRVWGTVPARRAIRDQWQLPSGFTTVAPAWGHVTIRDSHDIGPRGVNNFEMDLVRESAFGYFRWSGELMFDLWRDRLDKSLDVVADTDHERVFAHLSAPHAPYLYGADGEPLGPPDCWPGCGVFSDLPPEHPGLGGTIEWLNRRLVETVDSILVRRPDAVIVLFGDHGIRLAGRGPEDAHKPILLARTLARPGMFADAPRPDQVLRVLNGDARPGR